jgi:hypothetical protein
MFFNISYLTGLRYIPIILFTIYLSFLVKRIRGRLDAKNVNIEECLKYSPGQGFSMFLHMTLAL